jgi:outer membrane protein assembly factor BamB
MQEQPPLVLRGGSAPKAQDGLLISGFANGEIVAFNEDTGKISWRQLVAEPSGTFAVERMVDIVADPVIVDNTIYVATYQGKIAALNLHNGRILWTKDASTFSGLAVTNNMVIISDANDYVTAFDRATGAQLWQQKSLEYRGLTAPATISHYAVVGDAEGYLHFIDTRNGRFAARVAVGGGGIVAAPIVNDNAVYVVTRSGYLAKFVL